MTSKPLFVAKVSCFFKFFKLSFVILLNYFFQWSGPAQRYVVEDEKEEAEKELEGFNVILQPPPVVKFAWSP